MSKVNWKELETEYVSGKMSYRTLANKYKVAPSRVSKIGKKQNWVKKRNDYRANVAQVTLHNARTIEIKTKSEKLKNLIEAADKLTDEINKALDDPVQLYRQILRNEDGADTVKVTKKMDTRALRDLATVISTMNDTVKALNDIKDDEDKNKNDVEIEIIEGKKEWAK